MKWIGQNIYDQISRFRNTVDFSKNVTFYQPINDANPSISIGASDAERLRILINYQGTESTTAQEISFKSFTESATANDGRFIFSVDETNIVSIQDGGLDLYTGKGISINGTDILTDSSGTATLSNIDALDATTVNTLNSALTAGDITGVTAGTNLSGGGTEGAVTINLANASTSVLGAASFSSDNFAASSGAITIKDGGVDLTAEVTGILPSANLDADTAHLSGTQTFTGAKTFSADVNFSGDNVTFTSANADDPAITIQNTTDDNQAARFQFIKNRGAAGQDNDSIAELDFYGYNDAGTPEQQQYARIVAKIHDATDGEESGRIKMFVASHDGSLREFLSATGGDTSNETDVVIGNGAASLTTIAGTLTMGSTAALTNAGLVAVAAQTRITACANLVTVGTIGTGVWRGTAIGRTYIAADAINGDKIADDAVDSEHYTDGSIDTAHIADDQVTFAKASGVTPKVFGSVIKLLPTDFMDNGDGGNTKFGIGYTDSAGSGYGMRVPNGATEIYAFVSIPEGMKATHVDIFDKTDLAIEVFEVQINATTMTSKGTGNCNTTLDITDVASTATNMLAIEITTTATTDRVYGGTVTIAIQ